MVINGLKPFLTCTLIGDTTVGKNVGSVLINDEKNIKNQWAIMPIVLRYFNSAHKSEFADGFVPDYALEDDYKHSWAMQMKRFWRRHSVKLQVIQRK
jgi:hypothetical protein